jgi:hypothetical protein
MGGVIVDTDINIDGAERTLSLLGKAMLVAYIGFPLSLVLISWLGAPAGEKGPFDSVILLATVISLLALLLCPILIGVVAAKIGKSGISGVGCRSCARPSVNWLVTSRSSQP